MRVDRHHVVSPAVKKNLFVRKSVVNSALLLQMGSVHTEQ